MLDTKSIYWGSFGVLGLILVLTRFVIINSNFQMLTVTAAILIVGAHQSLKLQETDAVTGKRKNGEEAITQKDALMFPVFGSLVLVSLYVCYKFIGKEYLNLLLTTYVMLAGVAAVANTMEPFFEPLCPNKFHEKSHLIHFNIPSLLQRLADGQKEFRMHFSKLDVITHLIGLALAGVFLSTKDVTIHNLFGMAFSIQAIRLVSLGQFMNAFIMLWGLFVYDIFWVFGTDVMVTVALSFEAPAKLIFIQSFEPYKQGILGLGDIVVPGIFVGLCLRFDDYLNRKSKKQPMYRPNINTLESFPKPYFTTVMVGYVLGLVATAVAMHLMKTAQPALLYLVPFTSIFVAVRAVMRGEFKDMLAYKEEDEKKEEEKVK
jgi:minor histocompatibility antigen H13